jgi:hypothetical protein
MYPKSIKIHLLSSEAKMKLESREEEQNLKEEAILKINIKLRRIYQEYGNIISFLYNNKQKVNAKFI